MAESSGSPTHNLRILVQPSEADSSGWEVAVYLGGACFAKKVTLSDPFTTADEDECRWYLEDYLNKSPFEKGRAEIAVESLNSYADSLFDQLHLSRVWRRLAGLTIPEHKVLEIDIIEDTKNSNAVLSGTVYRLHWEVLEYPRLWKNLNIRITVRRIIPRKETSVLSTKRVESWSRGVPAVNILLVVSRKLVREGGEEADPNLVLQSLETLKKNLEARGAAFRLNIEMVRPGSFKAFKKHLDERSRHRRGDIHIVHFDVHGQVGLRSEKGQEKVTTAAFLYFQSGKVAGTLAPVRAGAVAELLRKHNIRIVVLNACESAKANKGDEANVARTFTKAGVQNVLAMAYKILGSTCTAFMRCFYESLIAGGKPFSIAVRDAREQLRCSQYRDARFALKQPLEDWVVPVIYACGKDVELRITGIPDKDFQINVPVLATFSQDKPTTPSPLVGRGFDILRFETIFLASNITGLSGPAGVGKTAFIQHLLRCWEDTGLFEKTLYVQCSSLQLDGIDTPEALLQQLLGGKQNPSTSGLIGQDQTKYRAMIAELKDNFQVIVLDNLEASHSDVDEMNDHGRWSESTRVALMNLITDIVGVTSDEEEGFSFILVGRRNDDDWWKKHFPNLPTFPRYPLDGLSLPDAIEFADSLLREHTYDKSQWGFEEEVVLSQALNILQRNPLAIITVLRAVASQDQPWKELFEKVLFHQFLGIWPAASDEFSFLRRDMSFASISGPVSPIYVEVFAILALYWHQGCSGNVLNRLVEASQEDFIARALGFGVDRGYFSLDNQGFVERIHPLFTLVGRSIFTSASGIISGPLRWALEFDQDSISDASMQLFTKLFFIGISSRKLDDLMRTVAEAGKMREFEKDLRPAFYNILTCLRICSMGKELICIDYWPFALQMYGHAGMWFLSVDEMALLVKEYENFLRRFISRRTIRTNARALLLMISVGNFLTSAHLTNSTLPTKRAKEFSQLTFDVIGKTEDELLKDENLVGVISLAMTNRDITDFSQGLKSFTECSNFRSAISGLEGLPSQVDFESLTWDQFAEHIPSFQQRAPQIEHFFRSRDMKADIAEMQESIKKGAGPGELAAKGLRGLDIKSYQHALSSDGFGYTQSSDPTTRSEELENSLNVRNHVEAIKHYKALLSHAMEERNLVLVIELLNSLIRTYGTDEAFREELNQMLELKKQFESVYQMLQLCTSVAGLSETPETNKTLLEDIKSLDFMKPENGYYFSQTESLYENAQKKKSDSVGGQKFGRPPKKHFNDLLGQYREYAQKPGGQAKLFELGKQFGDLIQEGNQALLAGDYDKAIEALDKLVEIDDPTLLPGLPFPDMSIRRQMLVSSRDFMSALNTASRFVEKDPNADAITKMESLLHDYEIGKYPGLPDYLVQSTRNSLQRKIWQQHFKAWHASFNAANYTQALTEITTLRRLESSGAFDDTISHLGSFFAQDFTDFNHFRTLHCHFGESRRPRLALKTVLHLLQRYDHADAASTPPWLLPGHLEVERAYKWFYEVELEKAKYKQCSEGGDFLSVLPNSLVMNEMFRNIPERLGEMIPLKVLNRLEFDKHTFRNIV